MNKLMIAAAIVCAAVAANAASLKWGISNVKTSTGSAAEGYSAYLFISENTTGISATVTTLKAVTDLIGTDGWATKVANLSTTTQTFASTGTFNQMDTGLTGIESGALGGFAIVFDSDDLATAKNYYLVNAGEAKSVTYTSATGAKTLAFGTQATASADAKNWKAIPEPTSGLLLLLGVAGLALRRKQK